MKFMFVLFTVVLFISCGANNANESVVETPAIDTSDRQSLTSTIATTGVALIVLGTVQDAGSPQIGCEKQCCKGLFEHPDPTRQVVSLGVMDYETGQNFIFEATPDFPSQMELMNRSSGQDLGITPAGIALTHAHIGHYTGLMYLGKEAMNASSVPVYAMPRMQNFLATNGPWSQLVTKSNIDPITLTSGAAMYLNAHINIVPLLVPHRDEYSETVGYLINGPYKTALFVPDIDKWQEWNEDVSALIKNVDYAFLDATFYSGKELGNRDMSEIPHPSVVESMQLFDESLDAVNKQKVYFIHFNHTNPLLVEGSEAQQEVVSRGFNFATYGMILPL